MFFLASILGPASPEILRRPHNHAVQDASGRPKFVASRWARRRAWEYKTALWRFFEDEPSQKVLRGAAITDEPYSFKSSATWR